MSLELQLTNFVARQRLDRLLSFCKAERSASRAQRDKVLRKSKSFPMRINMCAQARAPYPTRASESLVPQACRAYTVWQESRPIRAVRRSQGGATIEQANQ